MIESTIASGFEDDDILKGLSIKKVSGGYWLTGTKCSWLQDEDGEWYPEGTQYESFASTLKELKIKCYRLMMTWEEPSPGVIAEIESAMSKERKKVAK